MSTSGPASVVERPLPPGRLPRLNQVPGSGHITRGTDAAQHRETQSCLSLSPLWDEGRAKVELVSSGRLSHKRQQPWLGRLFLSPVAALPSGRDGVATKRAYIGSGSTGAVASLVVPAREPSCLRCKAVTKLYVAGHTVACWWNRFWERVLRLRRSPHMRGSSSHLRDPALNASPFYPVSVYFLPWQ